MPLEESTRELSLSRRIAGGQHHPVVDLKAREVGLVDVGLDFEVARIHETKNAGGRKGARTGENLGDDAVEGRPDLGVLGSLPRGLQGRARFGELSPGDRDVLGAGEAAQAVEVSLRRIAQGARANQVAGGLFSGGLSRSFVEVRLAHVVLGDAYGLVRIVDSSFGDAHRGLVLV